MAIGPHPTHLISKVLSLKLKLFNSHRADLHYLDLPSSLRYPEMNSRRRSILSPSRSTCKWLLKNQGFRQWLSCSKGLFCVKGMPGISKSTLMEYTPLNLPPLTEGVTISFFFHRRGSDIQKTPAGMFRSLLYQLLANSKTIWPNSRILMRIIWRKCGMKKSCKVFSVQVSKKP